MSNLLVGPLVRAIGPDGVVIWTEWSHPCEVTLTASPDHVQGQEPGTFLVLSRTITVGGHYYALSRLTGLQSATWYSYQIGTGAQERAHSSPTEGTIIQCFRTLDPPNAGNALRLAYGSCRKLSSPEPDALNALASWLVRFIDEREAMWPRLLLLIGDQIYADEHIGRRKQVRFPQQHVQASQRAAQSFEAFARMYVEAWTSDEGIRQVFALLPTYMIFDDHEIINAWNMYPLWRARALQRGLEQTLVDGLVAYWVYQGWGNIGLRSADEHVLLAIMQQAAHNGEDVLEDLRGCIRHAIYEETALEWHFAIPTTPPIFVADVRADRPAVLGYTNSADVVPRIMSREQMVKLRTWSQEHAASMALLVSSVPILLPPLIGFAEYVTGVRPFHRVSSGPVRQLGQALTGIQQKLALRMSFDHWPAFGATWHELIELLAMREQDMVILSGDVHFSYAMAARRIFFPSRRRHAVLYQFVASPFRNKLEQRDKRLILGQAWIKRTIYGGVSTHMLPLLQAKGAKPVPSGMLFQNVVALVTFWPQTQDMGKYCIRHVYLGVKNRVLEEIGAVVVD
ncbi:MAG TPA: hypothetical protein DDW33_09490 [Ktedonobacter sp.]|nr:hypothetical protein [Ktedonobacter sp.]HCF87761.1 hypothetical protein [Ktedonobacter sp.]